LFIGNVSEPMTHDYRVAAALSYWNDFGNLDTPVTLLTPAFDRIARAAIAILTGAIVLSTLAGFGLVAVRLGRLARRGRGLAALRLATANTPLNAYFIFCAFMIVFYALTGNNWRTSGRNFFPFIVPALLLGVRYAPRVLPRPHWRRAFGGTVFALLALYSSVGSYDAAAAVVHRYYGPPDLPPLASYRRASGAALAFDRVGSPPVESAQAVSDGRPRVRATVQGDVLLIDGLAADIATRGAAGGVIAVLDGTKQYAAAYGFAHADLAERFHDPRLFWAGYRFEIPTANVALGPHRLRFYVVSHDRRRASEARASVNADVVPLAEAAASPEGERDTVDPPQDPLPALRGERRVFAASVDQVSPLGDARYWAQGPAWIRRGEYVFVKGWGLDFVHHRNLAPVDVVVDGSARFAAHLGDVRPDVMLGYSNLPVAATQGAGWSVAIPTAALRFGEHELCVTSVDPRSGRPLVLAGRVPFTIF